MCCLLCNHVPAQPVLETIIMIVIAVRLMVHQQHYLGCFHPIWFRSEDTMHAFKKTAESVSYLCPCILTRGDGISTLVEISAWK